MLIPCKVGFLPLQPPSIFHWFPHLSTKIYKNGHRNKTYKRLRHPPPLIMTRSEVSDEGWVNYIFENLGEELLAGCQILTFNGQWHCLFFVSIQKFPLQARLHVKGLWVWLSVSCLVVPFAMFNFPHTCKKREIAEIYLRNFFWIFRKNLGWEREINTAPKPSHEVAPSKMEVAPF